MKEIHEALMPIPERRELSFEKAKVTIETAYGTLCFKDVKGVIDITEKLLGPLPSQQGYDEETVIKIEFNKKEKREE